jgi:hypothetical protein
MLNGAVVVIVSGGQHSPSWSGSPDPAGVVEETFHFAKNETGLDHYQVRRYQAWYRHITLSMLAAAFLAVTAHRERRRHQKGEPASSMTP